MSLDASKQVMGADVATVLNHSQVDRDGVVVLPIPSAPPRGKSQAICLHDRASK